jgi:DHA1 family 2-module integral membrane pump EmrD-like MFS transporter
MNKKLSLGILVSLITTLGLMATDIYAPAMPAVTRDLATSPNMVQLTVTFFLIAAGLSQLVYGPISDRHGRRPILIFGLGIYLVGALLCTFANNIPLLLLGRFIQGLGTGAIMALNRVIVRDAFSGVQLVKALSYMGAFIALAPAIAPAFGGFIEFHWGWRWIFGFLLIYAFILALLAWFTLPETHHTRTTHSLSLAGIIKNYGIILQNSQFWANVFCSGLAFAAMIACATINPFLLENGLGKSAAAYGFWAMITAIGFFIGMLSNAHIVGRLGIEKTLRLGNSIILLMGAIFIVTGYFKMMNVMTIILPTIGIQFGIALVFPNAFMGAVAPFPHMTGAAGAIYGCLQVAITFICSIIVALLSETTQFPLGILLLVIAILGLGIYTLLKRPHWETGIPSTPSVE